jgi:ABC-type oligopeptide transport system substrate-binding subunit
VGFPHPWGNLTPALQHTTYADALIKNQFESLVRVGHGGKVDPLAATSWTISDDYRVFTFKIDRTRRFSDGNSLSAVHFKEAWEYALTLQPKSANSSLQDVLYKVEGYEDFEKTKTLEGLVVIDDETFQVRFHTPFRMALDRLCGGRFGVFRRSGEKYLGTGAYVIEEISDGSLALHHNPFHTSQTHYKNIEVKVIDSVRAAEALAKGEIDVYASAQTVETHSKSNDSVEYVAGDEVSHSNLYLNGLTIGLRFKHLFCKVCLRFPSRRDMRLQVFDGTLKFFSPFRREDYPKKR